MSPLPAVPYESHPHSVPQRLKAQVLARVCSYGNSPLETREAVPTSVSVSDMLSAIQGRLTRGLRLAPIAAAGGKNVCLVGESSGRIKWIQPSGAAGPNTRPHSQATGHMCPTLIQDSQGTGSSHWGACLDEAGVRKLGHSLKGSMHRAARPIIGPNVALLGHNSSQSSGGKEKESTAGTLIHMFATTAR